MTIMKSILAAGAAIALTGTAAFAETKWDLSTAWGANNFHAQSAIAFADAVRDATDGSVDITVRLWVKKEDYWGVKFDMTKAFKEKFDQEDITIPYPTRTTYEYHMDAAS